MQKRYLATGEITNAHECLCCFPVSFQVETFRQEEKKRNRNQRQKNLRLLFS